VGGLGQAVATHRHDVRVGPHQHAEVAVEGANLADALGPIIVEKESATVRPAPAARAARPIIENVIRDLKYGMGLNHLPSGRFGANGAWLVVNVIAHNLARWIARIGLGPETPLTTRTLRRRLLCLPGRLTRSARRWTLHLPRDWPWADAFLAILERLRALPQPLPT